MVRLLWTPLLAAVLFTCLVRSAVAQEPVWLAAIGTFTGTSGHWDIGISQRIAAEIMLEEINANPRLLPGYQLKVVWQDDQCDRGTGLAARNLLEKTYAVFAPGKSLAELDRDHDGRITPTDCEPFEETWTSIEVSPDPVGLLGPDCDDISDAVMLAYRGRLPIISTGATHPAFSDRNALPNFFRTILPETSFCSAWIAMAKMLGQNRAVAIIGWEADLMGIELARTAKEQGLTDLNVLGILKGPKLIADDLVRLKCRIAILLTYYETLNVICEAYKTGFRNAVFMVIGGAAFGWWRIPFDKDCKEEQMTRMVHGAVLANMNFWRTDASTQLACSTSMTADGFADEFFRRQGKARMDFTFSPEGYAPAYEGVTMADAVCMYAQMLHEVLVNRGMPLSNLSRHTAEAYALVQEIFSTTDFEGVQGRVRFDVGSGDVKGWVMIQQLQTLSGTEKLIDVALHRYPDMLFLGRGNLTFHFSGESFFAGPWGSTIVNSSINAFTMCAGCLILNFTTNLCEAGPENTEFIEAAARCLCVPGYCEDGRGECSKCGAGYFSAVAGAATCRSCGLGTNSDEGVTSCKFCPLGRFANQLASSSCTACPLLDQGLQTTEAIASDAMHQCVCAVGAYRTPTGCMRCPEHSTTRSIMSSSVSDCICEVNLYLLSESGTSYCAVCPIGSATLRDGQTNVGSCLCQRGDYMPHPPSGCKACPEGMRCPVGSNEANAHYIGLESPMQEQQFLEVLPSYWSSLPRPMKVFLCARLAFCPGGKPGHCTENRDPSTIGCAQCLANMYEGRDGRCFPCEEGHVATLVVVGIGAAVVGCSFLHWLVNGNILVQQNSMTSCTICLGHAMAGFQTLGVFSSLTVRWVEPLRSLVSIGSLFTLDLRWFGAGCLVGGGPIKILALRQMLAPGLVCIILIIVALKKALRDRSLHYWVESVNTVGTIYQIFFVSIFSSAVQPFVCYAHPDGNGFSMVESPGVLCFEDPQHASMVLVGVLAILLSILPFVAIVIGAILRYRSLVALGRADAHFRRFRFLLFRYNPRHYYFSIMTLSRGLVLCLVPVAARQAPAAQILGMGAVLIVYCILQMDLKPWRGNITNKTDGVVTGCLLLLIVCAAVGTTFQQADAVIGTLGTIVFVLFFGVVFGSIATALYRRFVPRPYYSWFICHHKADAAAQARLLQIMLSVRTNTVVFIDSDHLTNLDELFDIVRCRTGCLVMYLTRDTLKRPWCAGEISVAFSTHKRMIAVKTPAYVAPEIADLEESRIATFLNEGPNLVELGVVNGVISMALSWVTSADAPSVSLDAEGLGQLKFQSLVSKLVSRPYDASSEATQRDFQMTVVISSLRGYDEATAAVGILISKIKHDLLELSTNGVAALCDFPAPEQAEDKERFRSVVMKSVSVVVLLSAGSLESEEQLNVIAWALAAGSLPTLPVTMPCFRFPSPDFFAQELPKRVPRDIINHLQVLFKQISVTFSPYQSTAILNAQATAVVSRLKAAAQRVSATAPETPGTSQSSSSWRRIPHNSTADVPAEQPRPLLEVLQLLPEEGGWPVNPATMSAILVQQLM